ncbi:unnamed protein product [Brassica rapa subsp. narinosa]
MFVRFDLLIWKGSTKYLRIIRNGIGTKLIKKLTKYLRMQRKRNKDRT